MGCILSTFVHAMSPINQLNIILFGTSIACLCFYRYRASHTSLFFQGLHFLMGLSLPLALDIGPDTEADIAQHGWIARLTDVKQQGSVHILEGVTKEGVVVRTHLPKQEKMPVMGQTGWLAGPCSTRRQVQNFSTDIHIRSLYCRGPFYGQTSSQSPPWWWTIKSQFLSALNTQRSPEARAMMKAITLGDKSELSGALFDSFTNAGANHLLAISGLHVAGMAGLLCSLVIAALGIMGWSNPKPLAILLSCSLAYFMLLIADGPVGAVRAFITYTTVGLMSLVGRRTDGIEVLFLAATIMVLEQPDIWLHIGFQLSFVSVLSIVTFVKRDTVWIQALSITGWSTLATAPLCTYYFGVIAPAGILTNLILVPFTTLALMPMIWFGLCLMPITDTVLNFAGELTLYGIALLQRLGEVGCRMWVIGTDQTVSVTLLSAGACLLKSHWKFGVGLLFVGCALWHRQPPDTVHFLVVGQGDSTIVQSKGKTALLDAGPAYAGERLLKTCRRLGISEIEVLVISHQHPDHFEGLAALVGRMPIKRIIVPNHDRTNSRLMHIERALRAKGTRVEHLHRNPIYLGNFTLNLYPPEDVRPRSENNASIAVHIHHIQGDIMVMGDLEQKGEAHLIRQNVPRIDILRAGHHGSRTSTHAATLSILCPSHVVLSLGDQNRFGFPHAETVRRIRRHGAGLWRTDSDGRITVKFHFLVFASVCSWQLLNMLGMCADYPRRRLSSSSRIPTVQ